MKPIALAILLSLVVQPSNPAWAARWYFPGAVGLGTGLALGYGGGYGWGGYGGYGWGGMGMTPGASYGHAMADMVRSQGQFNEATARGMVSFEEARGKYIQNEKQWTEVYQMQRRIREADRAQAVENARQVNQRYEAYLATRPSNLPPRLTASQLEPSTGRITWPLALTRDGFAPQRSRLDELFASRAHAGTTGDIADAITSEVRVLRDSLRDQIREIPTQDYMAARRFLDSLALEGRSPVI